MRTSWRRQPIKNNTISSWKEAYRANKSADGSYVVECLYEDVSPGEGGTIEEAQTDFLENIRLKMMELSEMLEFCARNQPK